MSLFHHMFPARGVMTWIPPSKTTQTKTFLHQVVLSMLPAAWIHRPASPPPMKIQPKEQRYAIIFYFQYMRLSRVISLGPCFKIIFIDDRFVCACVCV